ncbi:uncharacterized protein LOC114274747 [Camellia sinensis]|uniref:uncharacterized protein LOC114274747 n=1 Tax=Camellia sinensis TaxID=4442 RepID=UPI001036E05C|nr:uncharacterized protein LOC114274747 [Camellia sinensis]
MNTECEHSNIDDPGTWKIIDQNLRDFLVERGPVRRNCEFNFPKDDSSGHRHSSLVHYIRHLPNGEKFDRTWLIYSKLLYRVFCFCCKLFKQEGNKTELATEGFKDWRNIGERLKVYESVVKTLAKNNLPFRGSHEKIYEESNGLFLSIIEMIGEFDPTMEQHLRQIEKGEIHYHYLCHKIQMRFDCKSEAKSLVTRELETFEFLFSIVIWYNLLFHMNSISKLLQSEDMDIAVAVKQLDGLVKYVAMYREVGITEAVVEAKEMVSELGIEPTFVEKRIISRNKQFDENVSGEVTQ